MSKIYQVRDLILTPSAIKHLYLLTHLVLCKVEMVFFENFYNCYSADKFTNYGTYQQCKLSYLISD